MTHIEFYINWSEIGKAAGYTLLGIIIVIGLILFLFRNWRPY